MSYIKFYMHEVGLTISNYGIGHYIIKLVLVCAFTGLIASISWYPGSFKRSSGYVGRLFSYLNKYQYVIPVQACCRTVLKSTNNSAAALCN